jgi:phospholipid/cholesterol/gamma-HCH transport system substrate-binding protein
MNNKVNYTLVGFLVFVGILLVLGFSYWLLKPTDDEKTQEYKIYFNESVFGLNLDAPVKYRGISVGKVTKLRINPTNSEQVEVLVTIQSTTPIKVDTTAKLTAQGITGLSYINLSEGSHNSVALVVQDGEEYPVIHSVPSFFEDFEKSLGDVSTELSSTLTQTNKLLSDNNQKQIAKVIARTASVMEKFDRLLDDKTIINLQESAKNLNSITLKVDKVVPNIDHFVDKSIEWEKSMDHSFASIMDSYVGITESMDEIKRAIADGEFNFKDITADVMPTLNNTLLEMQDMMQELETTLQKQERSPADIFYKQEEVKKAPGEK